MIGSQTRIPDQTPLRPQQIQSAIDLFHPSLCHILLLLAQTFITFGGPAGPWSLRWRRQVGRTPWSAADALVGRLEMRSSAKEPVQGDPRHLAASSTLVGRPGHSVPVAARL